MAKEIKGLLTQYEEAFKEEVLLVELAEELTDSQLLWLYKVTKNETIGLEIDKRKGKR